MAGPKTPRASRTLPWFDKNYIVYRVASFVFSIMREALLREAPLAAYNLAKKPTKQFLAKCVLSRFVFATSSHPGIVDSETRCEPCDPGSILFSTVFIFFSSSTYYTSLQVQGRQRWRRWTHCTRRGHRFDLRSQRKFQYKIFFTLISFLIMFWSKMT